MNAIEQKFLDAMLAAARDELNDEGYQDGMNVCDYIKATEELGLVSCIDSIEYQKPIGIYIVDFFILSTAGLEFVVEIDGHESHKTKEQRFKDYRRERFLQEEGKTVFRFMASEIYVNATECVEWLFRIIDKMSRERMGLQIDAFERGIKVGQKREHK